MKLRLLLVSVLAISLLSSCRDKLPPEPGGSTSGSDTIAYYSFQGNLTDVTGHGHNGSAQGQIIFTSDRFGNPSGAIQFGGATYIPLADKDGLEFTKNSSFTITAWVKTGNTEEPILTNSPADNSYPGYQVNISKSSVSASFTGWQDEQIPQPRTTLVMTGHTKVDDIKWHFVAVSVSEQQSSGGSSSSTICLYVDGVLETDTTVPQLSPDFNNPGNPMIAKNALGQLYDGDLGEMAIYGRALTLQDIQARFHEGGWSGGNASSDLVWTKSTSGDFGTAPVGGSVVKELSALDTVSSACTIQSVTVTGPNALEFSLGMLTLPATVSHLDSIDIPVTWQPAGSTGSHTAMLTITYRGQSGTQTLTLAIELDGTVAPPSDTGSAFQLVKGTAPALMSTILGMRWALAPTGAPGTIDGADGYACGLYGILFATTDSGATWQQLQQGLTVNDLFAVAFQNKQLGVAVGYCTTCPIAPRAVIIQTTDQGAHWIRATIPASIATLRDVIALPAPHSFIAVGSDSSGNGVILSSADFGRTWQIAMTTPKPLYSIAFVVDLSFGSPIIAVGDGGQIFVSQDAGATWGDRSTGSSNLRRISMASNTAMLNGTFEALVTTDNNSTLLSTDAGKAWTESPGLGDPNLVYAAGGLEAWASSDRLHRTLDGGKTWRDEGGALWGQTRALTPRDAHHIALMTDRGFYYWITR
ncbi:MAG: LamG-like jellyroll fold domain-containing protein [Bacteroidota bacterium]|nr:LamG-like jellyroll fold domain-containing protein [Bacteroidota bacterium]MDP4232603.1 LamG-like jellyroll fold domain-containing protein [Bacteroidota bacterium]MDP4242943.1 LamG-like jellyroll fold domain-containing protein [Bacteroidota bacterium]MDP4286482.1 LamG-like jellyroll fold domain-containing protein [Bacteroidota bacterium]